MNKKVLKQTLASREHEFELVSDKCWIGVGGYSLLVVRDPNYDGIRIELYRAGHEGGIPVDAAYGAPDIGIPPHHPRLKL